MRKLPFFILLVFLFVNAYSAEKTGMPAPELVMKKGDIIRAVTGAGTVTISAGKGLKRTYEWEGCRRSIKMWPRKERWHGSLGAYFPGPGYHWKDCNGIRRCVSEEGVQNFNNEKEALDWLKKRSWISLVYTNDGLVVCFGKSPSRMQLNVEVWQLLIDGKKPVKLIGSDDTKIQRN